MNPWNGPLFIIGMPRSGTKLLRGLLNQHTNIAILTRETEFLPFWHKHWHLRWNALSTPKDFSNFYNDAMKLPFFAKAKADSQLIFEDEWYQLCKVYGFNLQGVFESLVRHSTGTTYAEHIIWGDKSPSYINCIDLILKYFPKAKIIHIIRDVRDYCLSINKAWHKNMYRAATKWADSVHQAHVLHTRWPDRICEITYEDILTSPEYILQKICQFLSITYEHQMTNLSYATENIGDAKGKTGIVSHNLNKYKTQMPSKIQCRIESLALNTMLEIGYFPELCSTQKKMHSIALKYYLIKDGICLIQSFIHEFGVYRSLVYNYRYYTMKRS